MLADSNDEKVAVSRRKITGVHSVMDHGDTPGVDAMPFDHDIFQSMGVADDTPAQRPQPLFVLFGEHGPVPRDNDRNPAGSPEKSSPYVGGNGEGI